MGYAGISNSVAIEFDTYAYGRTDISDNHISILRNGAVTGAALSPINAPFDLNGGRILTAWIDYDGTQNALSVYLSNTNIKPVNALLSYDIDLFSILGSQAYLGFSAGTGGLNNNHDILNWLFIGNN